MVFIAGPEGKRGIGRPRMRWRDSVVQDAEALGERNWRRLSMNKEEWKKLLKKKGSHRAVEPVMMMMMMYYLYLRVVRQISVH
jgi:hypothetical protein